MSTLLIFFVAVVCTLSEIKYNFLYTRNKVIKTFTILKRDATGKRMKKSCTITVKTVKSWLNIENTKEQYSAKQNKSWSGKMKQKDVGCNWNKIQSNFPHSIYKEICTYIIEGIDIFASNISHHRMAGKKCFTIDAII